ncbi:hypothetical protein GCM10010302_32180 [Streptomyces polychromogenes]|uniref:Uncharacterized protein n=1 Tax=Streptomyces polychromogenes TaxID=67342 RepID=A0ABP3F4X9_9ACTN
MGWFVMMAAVSAAELPKSTAPPLAFEGAARFAAADAETGKASPAVTATAIQAITAACLLGLFKIPPSFPNR